MKLAIHGGSPLTSLKEHTLWPIIGEAEKKAVMAVLDRGILSGPFAPEAMALQEEFAEFVGAKHALLAHSGTSALILALGAAGVGEGHEVIVPVYTFVATPLSVTQVGAVPVFCDVKPDTCNIDPEKIEALITPRTKAIMPVHVHGTPADLDAISAIAKKHDLLVIEDAAQAHGAKYDNRPVGALDRGGGFSLQSSKNLTGGEGGIFVTNDESIADRANSIRNFGQNVKIAEATFFSTDRPLDGHRAMESIRLGQMYRGNEMMAAVARAQLRKLPDLTMRAQSSAESLTRRINELPGLTGPIVPKGRTSVYHKFRVMIDHEAAGFDLGGTKLRDAIITALKAEGLEVGLWESAPQTKQGVFGEVDHWPFNQSDSAFLRDNYSAEYPVAQHMLDNSFILFSHSAPLIAQERKIADKYAIAFEKVWEQRKSIVEGA